MKNYEQMTEDVLHRAEMYAARQKRNRRITAGAAMAFGCTCMVALLGIGIRGEDDRGNDISLEQPSVQTDSIIHTSPTVQTDSNPQNNPEPTVEPDLPTCGFTLLAAYTQEDEGTPLVENLALPLNYSLRVRDLRGLSGTEAEAAAAEEREFCRDQMAQKITTYVSCMLRENYVISQVRIGCFRLQIEDYSVVESISVRSTTDYGWIDIALSDGTFPKGQDVTLTPEKIPETDKEKWLVINWKYSKAVLAALDADPATPLSEFSDTVIFTVNYTDGTAQQCEVRILIQDDGQIIACLQGKNVAV